MAWHDLVNLKVIPAGFPNAQCRQVQNDSLDRIITDFQHSVLSDTLSKRPMARPAMHIHLRDDLPVTPMRITTTSATPVHHREAASQLIEKLINEGIIAPVHEPTDWISRGAFVPKPNKGVRLVTDFRHLNKFVKRPVHPFPSAGDIMQNLQPSSTVFCKMDATQGYFQIPLDEESSRLTTFLLPSGRYRYLRAPMGLNASSDEWCFSSDALTMDLPWAQKIVDDILIEAPSHKVLFHRKGRS